jgi:SAM-dependent methyltransferase
MNLMTPEKEGGTRASGVEQGRCEVCEGLLAAWQVARGCRLLRCSLCGHVMRDLRLCPAGAREQVYGGSEEFDRVRLFFTRRKLIEMLSRFPSDRKLHILEVGFGNGQLLGFFQKLGHQVYGVEMGRPQSSRLDELSAQGARLFFQGLQRAELPAETLDLIYMIHVAEHLPDPVGDLRKLCAAAGKDALLYLVTPDGHSAGLRVFRDRWWHLEDPTHRRFFTPRSMSACLDQAGFVPLQIESPLLDSLTLEINSFMRLFYRRGAVMDHALVRALDLLLFPAALAGRLLWPAIRPNMEVLARRQ